MPKLYSAEFRREVCERMLAGEAVLDIAKDGLEGPAGAEEG